MKSLQELLKEYVEKSSYTIYSLSYASKINRTTLQRAITGERPISRENLDKLLPFLNLTLNEKKELEKAFFISQMGEYTYQKYIYVKDLLENIELNNTAFDLDEFPITTYSSVPTGEPRLLKGVFNIIKYIYQTTVLNVKNEEEPYICILSHFHNRFFKDLYEQFQSYYFQKLKIRHITPFVKTAQTDSESSLFNLQILSTLLPFALSNRINCTFSYYYEETDFSALSGIPFTYYILTNHNVISLSSDCQNALILPDYLLPFYRQHFDEIANASCPLLDSPNATGVPDMISIFSTPSARSDFSYVMESQPCIIQFIDNAMITKAINKEIPEKQQHMLMDLLTQHCKNLRTLTSSTSVFTREGYDDFVNNGRIHTIPDYLYRPLMTEERIVILKRLIQANEHGSRSLHMIKKSAFRPKVNFVSYDNSSIIFYFQAHDRTFQSCTLREPNIIASLNEFVKNLCDSELVYSIEETNDIFRNTINELQSRLPVSHPSSKPKKSSAASP